MVSVGKVMDVIGMTTGQSATAGASSAETMGTLRAALEQVDRNVARLKGEAAAFIETNGKTATPKDRELAAGLGKALALIQTDLPQRRVRSSRRTARRSDAPPRAAGDRLLYRETAPFSKRNFDMRSSSGTGQGYVPLKQAEQKQL